MEFTLSRSYELLFKKDISSESVLVSMKQCFPKSMPDKYLSVLDKEGRELELIDSLSSLDEKNKKIVSHYLQFKNFRMRIKRIISVEEEFGVRVFNVETDRGERSFQMTLQSWPYMNKYGQVIFEDINSDVYMIDDYSEVDAKTKKYLYTYVE